MKKILYLVSTLKRSGPTKQLSYIIKYLDKNVYEPMVLTLSAEPKENSMKSYFTDTLGLRVETLGLSRVQGLLFGKRHIKKFIKENAIDLVHSQGIRADGLMSGIDMPRVATLRNYPYYDYQSKFGKLKGGLMVYNHMNTIRINQDNCIACAKSISEEFKKNNLQLSFIQNGVDIEKYYPLVNDKKMNLRAKLSIDSEKNIFISVGSLIPRKDVETVINGFKLYNKDDDSILLIVGDGFELDNLKTKSDHNIIFLGNISNVVEYLQVSDCFISASLAEGLPNTVLEAMACGLPVVLSDIPSHLELFEKEKGNFFTIKCEHKLSDMLKAISINFKEQKKLLLKIVNESFSAKIMSEKYQEIYSKKINKNKRI